MPRLSLVEFNYDTIQTDVKEKRAFRMILGAITLDISNDAEFEKILSIAVNRYNIKAAELAEEFGVYRSTIKRWVDGTSLPPNIRQRKDITAWISEKINMSLEYSEHTLALASDESEAEKANMLAIG